VIKKAERRKGGGWRGGNWGGVLLKGGIMAEQGIQKRTARSSLNPSKTKFLRKNSQKKDRVTTKRRKQNRNQCTWGWKFSVKEKLLWNLTSPRKQTITEYQGVVFQ